MSGTQKIHVLDEREGSQVPFLRGILTRSLQRCGVTFNDAYEIADAIRAKLAARLQISSGELRILVNDHLVQNGFAQEAITYREGVSAEPTIHVVGSDGGLTPFSKGRLSQSMEICGLDQETTYLITKSIEFGLAANNEIEIASSIIARKTCDAIVEHAGNEIAERYLQWRQFSKSGRPLILLVGGTTGSGKSTISSELAHRLDIVRTQSTDMLREVMRLMIPSRLLPTLHTSSFEAYKMFPYRESADNVMQNPSMITGYLSQAEHVGVGIEGVLNRAENERVSLIIEGVHVHPELQQQIAKQSDAVVIPIILAVLKKKRLRNRLIGRGQQVASRRSERYLENFDHIWDLQAFLLAEADHFNIPIIVNMDEDEAIRSIMQTISTYIARETNGELVDAPSEMKAN